ncbi:MAG: thiamine pyrophosphate-dependent enzyme [Chitinophagales bacterium]|nr:thiamine pyrophosphate-dependent enzyme [Chitinophagales bacterium]MDW8419822.1 thiamine pyrophosphate-dependent enzyme [Chitinophagales bacterium]
MKPTTDVLLHAYRLMCTAKAMAELYEARKDITQKYVHATSRGHEAIQLAAAFQLKPYDYAFPYYRDDAMLLGMGFTPYDLMLQLLAKGTDYFSGGRTYYAHPSSTLPDRPKIPHQSSATGMQVIPATGAAQGLRYKEEMSLAEYKKGEAPIVLCSLGDGAITEGEVSEAFQMAVLHQYPIIYLVQDNEWDISAHAREIRAQDASEYAKGFKGLKVESIDGTDFAECYETLSRVVNYVRTHRAPYLVHAKVPLLNHHTSGVRKEWYRSKENLESDAMRDPYTRFKKYLLYGKIAPAHQLDEIEREAREKVHSDFERALQQPSPDVSQLTQHIFVPTPVTEEKGEREPKGGQTVVMVDAALHAVDEILRQYPEALLYGQDVGGELGGVFREAALLAKKYGDKRVFNTPIMEAYIIGSTVGMSAVGCKPIVEIQFADYIFPGINQLFTEVSRSCYLSNGKWPIQSLIRVPIGAYGSGGPYHSSSVESFVLQIKGVKVAYPSNAADMKGLMKAAFLDPNPVVIFEHKGLYWSKVKGTENAKTIEPDEHYVVPLGKARIALAASPQHTANGETLCIITYGMGVHWAWNAAKNFPGRVEIIDLRSLNPLDETTIAEAVTRHGKVIVITEETVTHSFAEALAGRIASAHFTHLDAPVKIIGAVNTPAIPLNEDLERAMLPNAELVRQAIDELLHW